MDDPVTISLEAGPEVVLGLGLLPALRRGREGGARREDLGLCLLDPAAV
jgi:hypothetical protein